MKGDYDQFEDKYEVDELEKDLPLTKRPVFSVILIGIGFTLCFSSIFATVVLQYPYNENIGLGALILFYAGSFLSSLYLAQRIVSALGENLTLAVTAAVTAALPAAAAADSTPTLLISALIAGVSEGTLWTAAFVFITASAEEKKKGRYFTTFATFYHLHPLVGGGVLFAYHAAVDDYYARGVYENFPEGAKGKLDFTHFFIGLCVASIVSAVPFLFTRRLVRSKMVSSNVADFGAAGAGDALSLSGLFLDLPIIATSSAAMSVLFADIPYAINNTQKASAALFLAGGVDAIWSMFCVKIAKHMFDSFLPILSAAALPLAYVLATFGFESWWYFFGSCAALALVESSVSYQLNRIFIRDFSGYISQCNAIKIAFSSLGLGLGYILSLFCSLGVKLFIVCLCHGAALACFVVKEVQRRNMRTDCIVDDDSRINVSGSYDSQAVNRAVQQAEGMKKKKPKKGKKNVGDDQGPKTDTQKSEAADSYEEFSTEF